MITEPRLLSPVCPDAPLLVVATEVEASHFGDDLPVLLTGIGKVRAAAIMEQLGIAASRRVRGLGIHQRRALVDFIDEH